MSQPQRITFVLDELFSPETREMSDEVLGLLLSALTALDVAYLKVHPDTPLLYQSGIVYQEEPPGAEDWTNIPMILKLGWGDCLPLDTLVLKDGKPVTMRTLRPGDLIAGDRGEVTRVTKAAITGQKPLLRFSLSNDRVLVCSPEHRLFLSDDSEIRASAVRADHMLKALRGSCPRVEKIEELGPGLCCDITTDTGRFYLPESDLVVHNCEELACWRAAELQVRGIPAKAGYTKQEQADGQMLYHITVILPDGTIEDPSRQLGMR